MTNITIGLDVLKCISVIFETHIECKKVRLTYSKWKKSCDWSVEVKPDK